MVTMPMVSRPRSLATCATTGPAPVPVPPPIPAVMNTIFVSSSKSLFISSMASLAYPSATSGLLPAPRPSPMTSLTGTGELARH